MGRPGSAPRPTRIACALALALTLPATSALAISEFWVDGPGAVQFGTDMQFPDVAVDSAGTSIYVWNSFPGTDRHDIYLRRFDADGDPLEDPAIVNTFTTKEQLRPRIALARDDSFLVVWESGEDIGGDVYRFQIRCQAYDANGAKVGSDQYVSTMNTNIGSVIQLDVAALAAGGYVVVWPSTATAGNDASSFSVQARRVSSTGVPQGSQFQVNTTTTGAQDYPSVEALDDGGYFVAFTSPNTGLGPELRGRRYASNDSPSGNDFRVNTTTAGTKSDTEVVRGWDGALLLLWKDEEGLGELGEIRARLFDRNLSAAGNDFRVNTYTPGQQAYPRAFDWGPGGWFVTWDSNGSPGTDASNKSIQQRIVTGSNQFAGAQMQLNVFTTSDQREPGSGGRYGKGAVAWRSNGNDEDIANHAITGELWQGPTNGDGCLFCDDLEWGTTQRWSSTAP